MARNGSGIDENQRNLVKTARNFDASPAVTMGMRQDPYFESKREVSGSVRPVSGRTFPASSAAWSGGLQGSRQPPQWLSETKVAVKGRPS